MSKYYLVTGGSGFIGSALVKRLVQDGHRVRVVDDDSRGSKSRLADVLDRVDFVSCNVCDRDATVAAVRGVDSVIHCAFVNGTEFFYTKPQLVLDVGVRGMLNVLDGCLAHGVKEFVLASSSEVYQSPPQVPTDETAPMSIPDPLNPRYSYAAGKIISEMLAINYARTHFDRMLIFRPHNVYGPQMGWEHVIPQFAVRMQRLIQTQPVGTLPFPIQGSGAETRAFVYIDDFIDGLVCMLERGRHMQIYHIGTERETSIADLARAVAKQFGREIALQPSKPTAGGTSRRCPNITKLRGLGYEPRIDLTEGLSRTVPWYAAHVHEAPSSDAS